MPTRLPLLLAAVLAAFPSPGALAQDIRQTSVTAEFHDGEIKARGQPGGYEFLYNAVVLDGKIALCGVGVFTDIYTRSGEQAVLRTAEFQVNGTALFRDLSYFNRVRHAADLPRATAHCRVSSMAAPAGEFEYSISWPGRRVRF